MHSYAPRASNSGRLYVAIREGESRGPSCHRLRIATNKSACELMPNTTLRELYLKEIKKSAVSIGKYQCHVVRVFSSKMNKNT